MPLGIVPDVVIKGLRRCSSRVFLLPVLGGIFSPSLFIGAMLGTAVGVVFGNLFPLLTAPAWAYGTVGMAAVFSGAARAPFSAILIIFELTGNYAIILPLMTGGGHQHTGKPDDEAREHLYTKAAATRC